MELLNDHYLSPLTAPKEILAKFPPCVILVRICGSLDCSLFMLICRYPHGPAQSYLSFCKLQFMRVSSFPPSVILACIDGIL